MIYLRICVSILGGRAMLKYQFPAVRGNQAGKEYYICMVPMGLLSRIFLLGDSDVPPEYRAQRRLNEARIPEIRDYILHNRDSYEVLINEGNKTLVNSRIEKLRRSIYGMTMR